MRTYPPYARTISRLLVRGKHPACIAVLFSARWWYFDRAPKICLRPDEWALGRWEFGYLKGEHVVAIWGDEVEPAQFGELLIELMLAGPRLLWVCTVEGRWLYKESFAFTLRDYVHWDLTKGQHRALADLALARYLEAQQRELDLTQREVERAVALERDGVAFLQQRLAGERLTEQIFTHAAAPADERAA